MSNNLINKFLKEYKSLINTLNVNEINDLKNSILHTNKIGGTIYIFGNGGSFSTANHFAVDMTKNAKIKTISITNDNLITCLSNDYSFNKWIEKTIDYYVDQKDLVIFLSVSGNSRNIINALKFCNKKKIQTYSLTGHKKNNLSNKLSNRFIWINSMSYNSVEIIHSIILLSIVDLIIGKNKYSVNR